MSLPENLTSRILHRFALERSQPDLRYLTALLNAYVQTVPWESASRIVRRAHVHETTSCPRWPEEFWEGALERGLGGTCFESNYAFMAISITPRTPSPPNFKWTKPHCARHWRG